jgi:tRNA 2-thiocytidine biosynthesis protein TtcA
VNARKTLLRKTGKAIADFDMIREGDRIAVGVSGGKDSLALADALLELRRRSPVDFSLRAFTIEQGKFVRPVEPLGDLLSARGMEWTYYIDEPSFKLLEEQPAHGCDTCSRFRRRAVYDVAAKLGCNVVALGHTADDLCEALLRNALFTGRLSALPPVTTSRSGDFRLIRPLVYVTEDVTRSYVEATEMPITPCVCSYKTGTVREKLRGFLAGLRQDNPHVLENLLSAMGRIDTERLLDKRFLDCPPAAGAQDNCATISLSPEKLAHASVAIDSASCQDVDYAW